ncbi:MAG: hypothetical protein ACLPKT_18020 [Methylocella sp.]
MNHLVVITDRAPGLVAAVSKRASHRFYEFFTANIRNPNTCRAYARAAVDIR